MSDVATDLLIRARDYTENVLGFFFLGRSKPVDHWLQLVEEDTLTLAAMCLAVPVNNSIFANHVLAVEQVHNLVEDLQQVLVVVTVVLNLDQEEDLCLFRFGKGIDQFAALVHFAESLVDGKVSLLVPFDRLHDGSPDEGNDVDILEVLHTHAVLEQLNQL